MLRSQADVLLLLDTYPPKSKLLMIVFLKIIYLLSLIAWTVPKCLQSKLEKKNQSYN